MSPSYGGRRGPNVTAFIRDLNTSKDAPAPEENYDLLDDDVMFSNTAFFDFDSGQTTDYQAHPAKPETAPAATAPATAPEELGLIAELPPLDYIPADFNFTDFTHTYPAASVAGFPADSLNGHLQPLQADQSAVYGHQVSQQAHYGEPHGVDSTKAESSLSSPARGPMSFEEKSRYAAEEDKRRRNTAASARFRVKKKQREQALEKSAKDMTDKVTALETRIQQLETENKWLKNLIMEKNDTNADVASLWKDFSEKEKAKAAAAKKSGVKEER